MFADYDSPSSDLGGSAPDVPKNAHSMANFPSNKGRNHRMDRHKLGADSPGASNYDANTEPRAGFRKPAQSYEPSGSGRYLVSQYPS